MSAPVHVVPLTASPPNLQLGLKLPEVPAEPAGRRVAGEQLPAQLRGRKTTGGVTGSRTSDRTSMPHLHLHDERWHKALRGQNNVNMLFLKTVIIIGALIINYFNIFTLNVLNIYFMDQVSPNI